jgi:23S rRNA pseudouridine2605 synthase
MNNKEGNNKSSGGRANSSDHIQISQNLPCRSALKGLKKVKVTTKVAEVTTDKEKKPIRLRDLRLKMKLD